MKPRENPVLHLATSNSGKVRDFTAIAQECGVEMLPFPGFAALPPVLEDGSTFEQNARKKAQQYSLALPGKMVIADDSGLEVEALAGAPGVLSARYGAEYSRGDAAQNSSDAANNAHLLRELAAVPDDQRAAQFVCVIAVARDGEVLHVARGDVRGNILRAPRGSRGFGYDPLFFYPPLRKTFAELAATEKAQVSHRGKAFRALLSWVVGSR